LLGHITTIVKNYEERYRKTGLTYNIFKIAGIAEREVIICRVLADLLNPKGLHNQGDAYLKLFLEMVVKAFITKIEHFNFAKAKVSTEYLINENRRIDIIIDDGAIFIPIEVKIYAGEQKHQIADYAAFSRRMNEVFGFIPVLFLTPDGYESGEASKSDYISISFKNHIIPWLVKCLNLEETEKITPIREIIKQFIRAIKSFCGYLEEQEMENAISTLIAESRDNYEAALRIYEAVDSDALDFGDKIYEIFKDKIFNLVKAKIPETKYIEKDDEDWYFFQIPIGKDYFFYINFNMELAIEPAAASISAVSETANKIKRKMSDITGFRDDDWGEEYIWASSRVKYPGLENIDNDKIFNYELYRVYIKEPQAVADRIVSMVMSLRNI
jgi:hypothetical protein